MRRLKKYLDFVRSLNTSFLVFKIGYNGYWKKYRTLENNIVWQICKKKITYTFKNSYKFAQNLCLYKLIKE